ncbi:hypothetical protein GDO81_023219 [Engystomops pustulosus]|uniref:Uncharacterized protein n=1 Tax=Engystomops pustulosus TaxID=76066 RepID=A0AAV6YQZ8_ENGPU|nr:hypothetical protein GDO81_023219 [Engystomops pustulosus]
MVQALKLSSEYRFGIRQDTRCWVQDQVGLEAESKVQVQVSRFRIRQDTGFQVKVLEQVWITGFRLRQVTGSGTGNCTLGFRALLQAGGDRVLILSEYRFPDLVGS